MSAAKFLVVSEFDARNAVLMRQLELVRSISTKLVSFYITLSLNNYMFSRFLSSVLRSFLHAAHISCEKIFDETNSLQSEYDSDASLFGSLPHSITNQVGYTRSKPWQP